MMITVRPFSPVGVTVTTTGGDVVLSRKGVGTQSLRVVNDGTTTAMVQLKSVDGYAGPLIPILGGSVETFLLPNRVDTATVTQADGTVYFTTGEST